MLSLIYVSVASPGLTRAQVEDLADHAARANAERELTGLLAYNSTSFMQLLEGDGDAVIQTMERIEKDERHSNLTYIRQTVCEERECPDWSMKPIITPLSGIGSATVFTGTLPKTMQLDTRILFTSFASMLDAIQAERLLDQEAPVMAQRGAEND